MENAFGRDIFEAYSKGDIKGITIIENIPKIIHQQFANDTIMTSDSTTKDALTIRSIIHMKNIHLIVIAKFNIAMNH